MRGRETSMCGCLSHGPRWRPGPRPRHVPWLGIELVTLWFSVHAQSTELHQSGQQSYDFTVYFVSNSSKGIVHGPGIFSSVVGKSCYIFFETCILNQEEFLSSHIIFENLRCDSYFKKYIHTIFPFCFFNISQIID